MGRGLARYTHVCVVGKLYGITTGSEKLKGNDQPFTTYECTVYTLRDGLVIEQLVFVDWLDRTSRPAWWTSPRYWPEGRSLRFRGERRCPPMTLPPTSGAMRGAVETVRRHPPTTLHPWLRLCRVVRPRNC
jgi:hypothetical protein